jgi:hypothetical protein
MHLRHLGWIAALLCAVVMAPTGGSTPPGQTPAVQTETLVLVRHGEKPAGGYGQINCQGMNRALALPRVLIAKFGKPDFIFAPDPSSQTLDPAGAFDYVRPLATIEPTAVALGLPVNTQFGFRDIDALQGELLRPRYRNALIFIAWEHTMAEGLARLLTSADGEIVPRWESADFDSIYIVRIRTEGSEHHAHFEHGVEGLDGQAGTCAFAP